MLIVYLQTALQLITYLNKNSITSTCIHQCSFGHNVIHAKHFLSLYSYFHLEHRCSIRVVVVRANVDWENVIYISRSLLFARKQDLYHSSLKKGCSGPRLFVISKSTNMYRWQILILFLLWIRNETYEALISTRYRLSASPSFASTTMPASPTKL